MVAVHACSVTMNQPMKVRYRVRDLLASQLEFSCHKCLVANNPHAEPFVEAMKCVSCVILLVFLLRVLIFELKPRTLLHDDWHADQLGIIVAQST